MAEDLQTLDLLGGNYYNFHPGSHVGQAPQPESALFATRSMRFCAKNRARRCFLETMAGKGGEVGSRSEELRAIIDGVEAGRTSLAYALIRVM